MHIHIVPNRRSSPAVLLRESYREGGKVKKRTLANLSSLPSVQVEAIRLVLKGERLVPIDALFDVSESHHHGHVEAVRTAMKRLLPNVNYFCASATITLVHRFTCPCS